MFPLSPPSGPEAQMRRRVLALALAVGSIALLVVLGMVGVWWTLRPHLPERAAPAAQAPALPLDTQPGSLSKSDAVAPVPRDKIMDVLGTLTKAHLYQTFLSIVFLADASEHDLYPEAFCKQRLDKVLFLMDAVDHELAGLSKSGLEEQDAKRVADCQQAVALLRTQARELRAFWDTPAKDPEARAEHLIRYRKARTEAGTAINEMIAIKE
jgi:hypothetical protein